MWLVWESPKHFKACLDYIENPVGSSNERAKTTTNLLNCMPAIGGVMPAREAAHLISIGEKPLGNSFIPMEFSPNTFYKN